MKTFTKILLTIFMGTFSISSFAQTPALWGMTYKGGVSSYGILFKTDVTGENQVVIYNFDGINDGANPFGSLMQASNGKFYGMCRYGGTNNYGTLFEYDPVGATFTKKLDFDRTNNGAYPVSSLIQISNGKLYGTCGSGGTIDNGVLFEYDPAGSTYTKKIDFNSLFDTGAFPYGSLLQASNGKLYGITEAGGIGNYGILFEYDPVNNTLTKKVDFEETAKGSHPKSSLIQATNGKLYGMCYYGGTNDYGTLFEYDPASGTFTKKLDFDGTSKGANPYGALMEASNGKLYGMARAGGSSNKGTLFEYDPASGTYTKKLDFDGTSKGANPIGALMEASNGKLYGMCGYGGTNNYGTLFEYDPASGTFTKKLDFNGTNGQNPMKTHFIEVDANVGVKAMDDASNVLVYPNPSMGMLSIEGQNIRSVSIIDLSGKTVLKKTISGNNTYLDLKALPKSVYFIKIEDDKGVWVEKLILR